MKDNNIVKLETFLIYNISYSKVEGISDNEEIIIFIKDLFEIIDDVDQMIIQYDKEEYKKYLNKIYAFIKEELGVGSILTQELATEIRNVDSNYTIETKYYSMLLKLRKAIEY